MEEEEEEEETLVLYGEDEQGRVYVVEEVVI